MDDAAPKTRKNRMISLRLTDDQVRWLDNAATFIRNETGCQVTRASIILRLMEKGLPHIEEEMQALRARSNAGRKRFPKLHLAYNGEADA